MPSFGEGLIHGGSSFPVRDGAVLLRCVLVALGERGSRGRPFWVPGRWYSGSAAQRACGRVAAERRVAAAPEHERRGVVPARLYLPDPAHDDLVVAPLEAVLHGGFETGDHAAQSRAAGPSAPVPDPVPARGQAPAGPRWPPGALGAPQH